MTKPLSRYTPGSGVRFRNLDDPETLRTFLHNLGEGIYISNPDTLLPPLKRLSNQNLIKKAV